MTKTLIAAAAVLALLVATDGAQAATGHVRARGANGFVAAGAHNGNAYVRGRGHTTNADGSVTAASGGGFKLNNGAYGARASTTTYGTDGSVTHSGGAATYGARGSAQRSGDFTRSADGTTSGERDTQVTSNTSGNTYNGQTTYNSDSGFSHSATCHDAAGNAIACPQR